MDWEYIRLGSLLAKVLGKQQFREENRLFPPVPVNTVSPLDPCFCVQPAASPKLCPAQGVEVGSVCSSRQLQLSNDSCFLCPALWLGSGRCPVLPDQCWQTFQTFCFLFWHSVDVAFSFWLCLQSFPSTQVKDGQILWICLGSGRKQRHFFCSSLVFN